MPTENHRIRISLVAVPDSTISTLTGMYDMFNCFGDVSCVERVVSKEGPFDVEIVGGEAGLMQTASGLPVPLSRAVRDIEATDIIIVPSLLMTDLKWVKGRYPELVTWMRTMHDRGAILCAACSGALLLAETGLLDQKTATLHWAFERTFRENFPTVTLDLDKVLVTTGERNEIVMSGAAASWPSLVLNIIARYAGPATTQAIARYMLIEWHIKGQTPYISFHPPQDHDDAIVNSAQEWLKTNYSITAPVEELVARSGVSERSFKRRFGKVTGLTPITYVQSLRVEEAKRCLECSSVPIDEISWNVGYEDPAFFRRLFKRITTITPGAYRKRFQLPENISPAMAGLS